MYTGIVLVADNDLTITGIALKCVTLSGRSEEEVIADYERRCSKLRIIPLYGQLKSALVDLHREGKVKLKTVDGRRLLVRVK